MARRDTATVARDYLIQYPNVFPDWLVRLAALSSMAAVWFADGIWETVGYGVLGLVFYMYGRREARLEGYLLGHRDGWAEAFESTPWKGAGEDDEDD